MKEVGFEKNGREEKEGEEECKNGKDLIKLRGKGKISM